MISHEKARENLNYLYGYFGEDIPRQYILEQYIEEQEKKDEKHTKERLLLELYRELHETPDTITYKNLLEQIKALEEELK